MVARQDCCLAGLFFYCLGQAHKNGVDALQWLVLAAVANICPEKPSIQEVAKRLATSHQNVKAIALNLEKSGFMTLEKDKKDKRVTRLSITPKTNEFWQKREDEDKALLVEVFKHLSNQELILMN